MDNVRGVQSWAYIDKEAQKCKHCGLIHRGVSSISQQNAVTNSVWKIKQCGERRSQRGFQDIVFTDASV